LIPAAVNQDLGKNDAHLQAEDVQKSEASAARTEERSLAEQLLAKHSHEEHHSTLNVSILEAKGLKPRQGKPCPPSTLPSQPQVSPLLQSDILYW
jgi:hypothetical protein